MQNHPEPRPGSTLLQNVTFRCFTWPVLHYAMDPNCVVKHWDIKAAARTRANLCRGTRRDTKTPIYWASGHPKFQASHRKHSILAWNCIDNWMGKRPSPNPCEPVAETQASTFYNKFLHSFKTTNNDIEVMGVTISSGSATLALLRYGGPHIICCKLKSRNCTLYFVHQIWHIRSYGPCAIHYVLHMTWRIRYQI